MKLQLLTLAVLLAAACVHARPLSAEQPAPVYGQQTAPAPVYCCPPNGNGGYGQGGYGNGGYGYNNGGGYNGGGYYNSNRYQGGGANGGLPQGRRYYNGRYFGNFNNRYYGPQYGYF